MNGNLLHEMGVTELQRTLFDVLLGIQTAQGYVDGIKLYQALGRYGFDEDCTTCFYRLGFAEGALMERGNLERDSCFGHLYVR